MKLNLCTISFRNELASFDDLVRFAAPLGFYGIELWGVHALALSKSMRRLEHVRDLLQSSQLRVPVISSYLDPLCTPQQNEAQDAIANQLIRVAKYLDVPQIRVFAGNVASGAASKHVWETCFLRMKKWSRWFADEGLTLIVETHPHTLADSLASTQRVIDEIDEPNLKINLDFLHIWEAGDDVFEAYKILKDRIGLFHLKNVRSKKDLDVFSPSNVFSPHGKTEGQVSLGNGAIDYCSLLKTISEDDAESSMSLEWFGEDPYRVLAEDVVWINSMLAQRLQFDAV